MKIRKIYLYVVLILLGVSQVACKGSKEALGKAKVADAALQYSTSIDFYKQASSAVEKKDKADIIFKICQNYHSLGDFKQTELWAIKADKVKYGNPLVYLYWADALKGQGRYDEATVQYNKYKELKPSDERGEIGAKSCQIATE